MESLEVRLRQALGKRRAKGTIDRYAYLARQFVDFTDQESNFTKQQALSFVDRLIERGQTPERIRWVCSVLNRIYRIADLPNPITKDDAPKLPGHKQFRPMPLTKHVDQMVRWARRNGNALEVLYMIMSTTYGLRRGELARLTVADFSHNLSMVNIHTLKHGIQREHVIPDQVRTSLRTSLSVLKKVPSYSDVMVSQIYGEIAHKSGYKRQTREGWHGIRRLLDTELLARNVPWYVVKSYMRWSGMGGDMPGRYFNMDEKAIDRLVFEHHPFLEFWA